jgi:hypothetical protein
MMVLPCWLDGTKIEVRVEVFNSSGGVILSTNTTTTHTTR